MSLRRAALLLCTTLPLAAQTQPKAPQQPNPNRPTLFVVGDLPFASIYSVFDPNMLKLVDSPAKGQSTRTYINSGTWETLTAQMKSGDFVLIGFIPDHISKEGSKDRDAATRTLHGAGDGTFDYLDPGTHKLELIHSYGWYLRKIVVDSINHGAKPILCSPPSQTRANSYADWAKAIATEQHIPYLDLSANSAIRTALEAVKPDPLAPTLPNKSSQPNPTKVVNPPD